MNEGKPGPPGERNDAPGTTPADQEPSLTTDGDFELARPTQPRPTADGDYELDRPLRPAAGAAAASAGVERPAPAEGEALPDADAATGQPGATQGAEAAPGASVSEPTGAVGHGQVQAEGAQSVPSAGVSASAVVGSGVAQGAQSGAAVEASVPRQSAPKGSAPADSVEPQSPATAAVPGDLAATVAEQPRPLHDPDPYSTPPYGEPGPWAPAPPVQHPATTPAHGVALAPHPQSPLAPAPGGAPVPPPGAHLPAPGVPAQAPGMAGAGATPAPFPPGAGAPAQAPGPHGPGPDATTPDPWGRYDPWAAASATAPLQLSGEPLESEERQRKRGRKVLLAAVLVLALVCGLVGGLVGAYLERNGGVGAVELPQAGKESAERAPGTVAGIAAQALPSVVTLHVSGGGEAGTGTGFVLDRRGHILTNDHVVEPAGNNGEITVTFHSGDTAKATVVGRDSGYDLAVVKVKGVRNLTPLALGNSDNVQVGDPVVAIGAPFDLAGTVTSGIISAKERPITAGGEKGDGSDVSYVDALQTDAPINPGNSGGPLLDAKARVIGINSAIRSAGSGDRDGGQAGSIGLGFAIPINQGKRVAEELINTGKATHPVIGITLDMEYTGDGARVGTKGSDGGPPVATGGPGAKAGIKPGDVITKVDGQRIHSGEELIVKTRAHRPGDRLELTLERDGKELTISLVLGSSGGE